MLLRQYLNNPCKFRLFPVHLRFKLQTLETDGNHVVSVGVINYGLNYFSTTYPCKQK